MPPTEKQGVSSKGITQRRSYHNMAEHKTMQESGGIEMTRGGSKSSINSTESSQEPNIIAGQGLPLNFGIVVPGIYRSSYPQEADYSFLQQLGLKSIITLVDKDMPETFAPFLKTNNIKHFQISMEGTKKQTIPLSTMSSILELVHDKRNQPVLIHCNQGKHRTGCVVAITRMLQQWTTDCIIDEYKAYAQPKIRDGDVEYIQNFKLTDIAQHAWAAPIVCTLPPPSAMEVSVQVMLNHHHQHDYRSPCFQQPQLPVTYRQPQPPQRPRKGRLLLAAGIVVVIVWQSVARLMRQQNVPVQGS